MSASSESFTYHLTPGGWVEGSEKLDFGHRTDRPVPSDRVLTVTFYEKLPAYGKMTFSTTVEHESHPDIPVLLKKHGYSPHGNPKDFSEWMLFVNKNS